MEPVMILAVLILVLELAALRKVIIDSFKISYYETKLDSRGVDIDHVKNIGLWKILKL